MSPAMPHIELSGKDSRETHCADTYPAGCENLLPSFNTHLFQKSDLVVHVLKHINLQWQIKLLLFSI